MKPFKISGFQKLTLLDFPGHVACTVFTSGCNFRCPFCHNASLVTHIGENPEYTAEDILNTLKKRQGILEGVCITGGEPTLMPGLCYFMKQVKDLGFLVKLDTNGTNPDMLTHLIDEKAVDYIAMDIKNSKEKYSITAGVDEDFDLSSVERSVEILMSGRVDFEFRTTVADPLHQKEDFEKIGRWLCGDEKYFLQKFVNSGNIIGRGIDAYSDEKMREFLSVVKLFLPNAQLRGI